MMYNELKLYLLYANELINNLKTILRKMEKKKKVRQFKSENKYLPYKFLYSKLEMPLSHNQLILVDQQINVAVACVIC